MGRSIGLRDVADKHHNRCPQCACREAIVVLDTRFEVYWQCVDCDCRWAASLEESALLLGSTSKTIH